MPASWFTKSDATEIRLAHPHNRAGMAAGEIERSYDLVNDPRFQDEDKTKVAAVLKELFQEDLTTRIRVRDLPDDEPTKTVDPARPDFFWEGHGINRELVARSTIVTGGDWDGEKYAFGTRRVG